MATSLTRIGKLTPEVQLAQAVSEFEAILTLDEKIRLKNLKSTHHPDAIDIVRLTSDIDRSSQLTRKCVGTRFANVLRAIQAFTSIGDMVVGGSQNMMASGIWASVRFTLQLATNHASFLEKLSTLFMEIGRSAPRYQELALVYHRSSDLQKRTCEYFITLVQLCTKAVQFTRRNGLNRLLFTTLRSFQDEFGDYTQKFGALGNSIKEEVMLLSAKTQEEEARQNSTFRSILLDRFDKSYEARRKLASKLLLLDACSVYDYTSTWRQVRKKGNTASLSGCNEYITWRDNLDATNTLVCFGKLGSGKSVFAANLIEDLLLNAPKGTTAYFICRHDVTESLQSRTILGSLLRQWLEFMDMENILAQQLVHKLDLDMLVTVYREYLAPKLKEKPVYVVIDGLDDCVEHEKQTVIKYLRDIAEYSTLRLFLTTRSELELTTLLIDRHFPCRSDLQISIQDNDIADYVNDELQRRLESGSLSLNDPEIIVEIQHTLVTNAHGMFLWVVLQIDSICSEETDNGILKALRNLPRDLPEVYDRILERNSRSAYTKKLLQLVFAAYRPLTLWELREALSITPGDDTIDKKNFITDIQKTISSCGSLLEVDEESLTVHYIHPSAKQHLSYSDTDSSPDTGTVSVVSLRFSDVEANCLMGGICLTYLNWSVFETQLTSHHTPWQISGSDAVSASVKSPLRSASIAGKVAQMYLKRTRRISPSTNTSFDFKGALMEAYSGKDSKQPVGEFFFLSYAIKHWIEHCGNMDDSMGKTWNLWHKLINNPPSIITRLPWDMSDDYVSLDTHMRRAQWALDNCHQALVLFLLKHDREYYLGLIEKTEEIALKHQLKGDWGEAANIRHRIVKSIALSFAAAPSDFLRATWNLALSLQALEKEDEIVESFLTHILLRLKEDNSPFIDSILDSSTAFQKARNNIRQREVAKQILHLAYSMSSRILGKRDVNTLRLRHDIEHFEEKHAKSLAL